MKRLLFHTSNYKYLADELLATGKFDPGKVSTERFSDGERYQQIQSGVEHRDVVLLGGTISDDCTLELFDLASAIVSYGANSLSLVVPYYGYGTMERAVLSGEVVTAKTRARLLSAIPRRQQGQQDLPLRPAYRGDSPLL